MSHAMRKEENALHDNDLGRVIPCNELDWGDPIKWLRLGLNDMVKAPLISLFYGLVFTIIPLLITYLVSLTENHLVIAPALVAFMMLGPFLAAGLYDTAWEFEKGHTPSLWHSIKAMHRNSVHEWAFAILLLVTMIFWLRVASIIHALYPPYVGDDLTELIPFLAVGTAVGAILATFVFTISAFTQPTLVERKVDLMTAVLTSINAVWSNKGVMMLWAFIILACVAIGFVTYFFAFLVIMPLLGFASWHAYIDAVTTKRERKYM
ncbi:hypothetical protein C2869_02795 [Saccharobesus litoralis]|uniref:DUF2189 domain-containing protein n=1 Tax=Saccharobesus litoralis TaxID=2172099 RepID=A0A2S0VMI6_9ALTE|nr:DUF2189 domain-containing protein [Saccharobesus litoralis]AWB65428.1 hypothetical protein C2869_02795 [Saccharobesus litoralis]